MRPRCQVPHADLSALQYVLLFFLFVVMKAGSQDPWLGAAASALTERTSCWLDFETAKGTYRWTNTNGIIR